MVFSALGSQAMVKSYHVTAEPELLFLTMMFGVELIKDQLFPPFVER